MAHTIPVVIDDSESVRKNALPPGYTHRELWRMGLAEAEKRTKHMATLQAQAKAPAQAAPSRVQPVAARA